jgi:hypothetical protein
MPWTRRQVKKLLSSGSPLTEGQQEKMKAELHANPAMGHAKKGSAALKKRGADKRTFQSESYSYNHKNHLGRPKKRK